MLRWVEFDLIWKLPQFEKLKPGGLAVSVLIKNGRIVTAVDDYHADIFIADQTIDLIGANLSIAADHVIDAGGKLRQEWRKVKVEGHVEEVLEAVRAL